MRSIYFDTNQLYYIRKIADEAAGWEYGDYEWAYRAFPNTPELIEDIRALCYIVALQYEWYLHFSPSDASFAEIGRGTGHRAQATREAWAMFREVLRQDHASEHVPFPDDWTFVRDWPARGRLSLDFVDDLDDRVIIRHFASEGADVLLTSDGGILKHKERLAELNIVVMRPSEWLNTFLESVRGGEDAVDWLERVMFTVGISE